MDSNNKVVEWQVLGRGMEDLQKMAQMMRALNYIGRAGRFDR